MFGPSYFLLEQNFMSLVGATGTEAIMSLVDPWEKAAECDRAIRITLDPRWRVTLTTLRDMWIALGNQRGLMTATELARETEAIGRLHADLAKSIH
jgi:hypothetical protein